MAGALLGFTALLKMQINMEATMDLNVMFMTSAMVGLWGLGSIPNPIEARS